MHRLDIILGNRGIYIEQICTRNVIVILKTTESNLEPSLSILEVVCLDVEQEVSSGSMVGVGGAPPAELVVLSTPYFQN